MLSEIPGAQISIIDGGQTLLLPATDSYQLQISPNSNSLAGLASTDLTFTLSVFDPLTDQDARILEFNNVVILPGETGISNFQRSQDDSILTLSSGVIIQATVNTFHLQLPKENIYIPLIHK